LAELLIALALAEEHHGLWGIKTTSYLHRRRRVSCCVDPCAAPVRRGTGCALVRWASSGTWGRKFRASWPS